MNRTDTTFISRSAAVKAIAGNLADRDSFIIIVPPQHFTHVASRIGSLPAWVAYVDNGTDLVVRTSDHGNIVGLEAVSGLIPFVVIFTVPKTVPAKKLEAVVGQEVPEDGSQDILFLCKSEPPYHWPHLFLDAVDIVDPKFAANIRASSLVNLN